MRFRFTPSNCTSANSPPFESSFSRCKILRIGALTNPEPVSYLQHDWGKYCLLTATVYENERTLFPVLPVAAGHRVSCHRQLSFGFPRRSTDHHLHSSRRDERGGHGASARRHPARHA